MKILIVGMGSIGRRHLSCLQKIDGLELAALRTSKGTLQQACGVQEFYNFEDALAFGPEGVIIANPTSLHVETALPFLEKGCRVLIEKPVAATLEDAKKLENYSDQIRVAYCMRFLPFSKYFKDLFQTETPFKISFKRSFYLPKWHPYADYRKEYTARKDLGGGVIRTLSHEIDLAIHWLGVPQSVTGITDKISSLDVDTDDFAFFSLKTGNGARVNFELDFFSPTNINVGEAFTNSGKYHWDMGNAYFTCFEKGECKPLPIEFSEAILKMYLDQILDFIGFVKKGVSLNATLNEAITVLKIIEEVDGVKA